MTKPAQPKAAPAAAKPQKPAVTAAPAPQSKSTPGTTTVRKNAATKFKECLDLAVKEAGTTDDATATPDTAALASAIEAECHKQTGASQHTLARPGARGACFAAV